MIISKKPSQKAETIQALSLREQIILRPDTYLGSINSESATKDVLNDGSIQPVEFDYNHGLFQIYVEIISNAIDNVARSRKFDIDPGEIQVTVTDKEVKVRNWGYSIPVEPHGTVKGQYVPQVAFFNLLTSSNYNDSEKRRSSGRNGYGAKLTNVFSEKFTVKVYDSRNMKYFELTSQGNMSKIDEPKIMPIKGKIPFSVEVNYVADFKRFGVEGYSDEFLALMEKYIIDAAAITGVPTVFNGCRYELNFKSYVENFYYGESEELSVVHLPQIKSDDGGGDAGYECEVLIVEDEGPEVSFINGVVTDLGGNHVKGIWDALLPTLAKRIKTKLKFEANQNHIKKYFRLFINASMVNPAFGSQSKAKLVSKVPKVTLDAWVFNKIMGWGWVEAYDEFHKNQNIKSRSKTDGKKVQHVRVEKADDANLAGTKHSMKCTLILTEGDSAKGFAVEGRSAIENGQDFYGAYPLRGKGLNTMNAKEEKIANNKEITNIKTLIGLKTGVDYSDPVNRRKLRYGHVLVLSDADDDGLHIRGLTMLIFAELFETLMEIGFIRFMETPAVRVYKNRKLVHEFYTYKQFNEWRSENTNKSYDIQHMKGLGSSTKPEQRLAFKTPFFVDLEYTDDCKSKLQLAFNKKLANERKQWLAYIGERPDPVPKMRVGEFIDNHFKHFSWADNMRSLPSLDGLKSSQRKCLYTGFLKGLDKPSAKPIVVENFQGEIAIATDYDHGPKSLGQSVILLAQNYPGSNNLPLFFPKGDFGCRLINGTDTATRYLRTYLQSYCSYLFNKLDEPVLKHLKNKDGMVIEPYTYYPIICMPLVNGVIGIGTGYSCMIHPHNQRDIIKLHLEWLDFVEFHRNKARAAAKTEAGPSSKSEPSKPVVKSTTQTSAGASSFTIVKKKPQPVVFTPTKILPYFEGFTGKIKEENGHVYMYGVFNIDSDGDIIITEIPLKKSINAYDELVQDWVADKKIKSYRKYGTSDKPHFELIGYDKEAFGGPPSYDTLCLKDILKHETINFLNENHSKILSFDNIYELINYYSKIRLQKYEERRQNRIVHLKDLYPREKLRYKFVMEVIEGTLVVSHRDETELLKDMDERGYPHDFLSMAIRSFTKQKLEELKRKMQEIEDELEVLMKTTDIEMWRSELKALKNFLYPPAKPKGFVIKKRT